LIEAALVLPILLMLFLGLFAFARGWSVYVTMTRAAREGLREAVTTTCATCGDASYSSSQIQSKFVFPALQAVGINTSEIQNYTQGYTWMDTSDNVCGEYIDFQYPYTLTIPFLQKSITTVTLQTQIQMRLENQPLGGTCS
jgi:Flp pilus assembly protein TadG